MVDIRPVVTLLEEAERQLRDGALPEVLAAALTAALRDAWQRGIHPGEQEAVVQALEKVNRLLQAGRAPAAHPGASDALSRAVQQLLGALAFARRLQLLRLERKLSRPALAHAAGLHRATIHRLETGAFAPPAPEIVRRLAQALQVAEETLADTTEAPAVPPELLTAFQQAGPSGQPLQLRAEEVALLQTFVDALRNFAARGWLVAGPFDDELRPVAEVLLEKLRRSGSGPARGHWRTLAAHLRRMDERQFGQWLEEATRLAQLAGEVHP